jgi:predicted RNA-binding protein with PUA-like domain
VKEHYQDPTTTDEAWSVVKIAPFKALKKPVTLETIKKDKKLAHMQIIKLSRLSVSAVTADEFNHILDLSGTK